MDFHLTPEVCLLTIDEVRHNIGNAEFGHKPDAELTKTEALEALPFQEPNLHTFGAGELWW